MNLNYNYLQKILHKLYLKNNLIKKTLFQIEYLICKEKHDINQNQHLFIGGLPRSGTTILLISFYESGRYASLTYKDMPFILSPNINKIFSNNLDEKFYERPHKDQIKYNINSPEAFDEVFFKTFNSNEIKKYYAEYISLILKKYKKKDYLSKNNNLLKNISLIKSIFYNAIFIVPFRDPIQHSFSLMTQHKNFLNLQHKDNFILDYMNFLGHYEFGKNHKPWFKPVKHSNLDDINYWLEQWFLFYKYVYQNNLSLSNFYVVPYESICENKSMFKRFLNNKNLKINNLDKIKMSKKNVDEYKIDKFLLKQSNDIYKKLNKIYESAC